MTERPALFAPEHAAAFEDADVVREYVYRAPYPPATFDLLLRLLDASAPAVLDLGAGTGPIARALAPHIARVDAVDPSEAMIREGQRLARDHANVRWILGRAEDAPLDPPYGLVTAGASLHWMDWDVVMPRLASVLTDAGHLAIVEIDDRSAPWHPRLKQLFDECSVYGRTWHEFDLIAELERRGLFRVVGRESTSTEFAQPLEEYVRALHSHSSLARARIGHERARAFDDEVRSVVSLGRDGLVHRPVVASVVWGRPLSRT